MSRPSESIQWATDANHAAGAEDWSGQPNKVEPSSGVKASGLIPLQKVAAEAVNWLFNKALLMLASLDINRLGRGRYEAKDHFATTVLNTSLWTKTETGSGSTVTLLDDAAADGFGALKLVLGSSGTEASVIGCKMPIGTGDFIVSARVRTVTGTRDFDIGIKSSGTSTENHFFRATTTGGSGWKAFISGSAVDCGVAFGSTYQDLRIERIAGVCKFYIDGVLVDSRASTVNIGDAQLLAYYAAAGAGEVRVDRFSIWVEEA
jgi:hypothetical protein